MSTKEKMNDGRGIAVYPWDEWTDGSEWLAQEGTAYTCLQPTFITNLHRKARQLGLRVVTNSVTKDKRFKKPFVKFQFVNRDFTAL